MIKILVDSSSDYTLKEAQEKGFYFASLNVMLGGQTYLDGQNLEADQFYQILTNTTEFPKTSQPSPQDFVTCFEEAAKNGDEVICILLSSSLSGTFQCACLAKSMVDYDKIYLIDSLSATIGIRLLVEYAEKLIAEGTLSAAEIAEKIDALKSRIHICAAVDTLEYLSRGGRVSKAAAAVGEMAKLKPIITLTPEGTVSVMGKCIGKNKAISFILKHLNEVTPDPDFPLYSAFTYGTDNAEKLEQKAAAEGLQFTDRLQLGSTIGAHTGPGVFGFVYIAK